MRREPGGRVLRFHQQVCSLESRPGTTCVAQASFRLKAILSHPAESWDDRHEPPHPGKQLPSSALRSEVLSGTGHGHVQPRPVHGQSRNDRKVKIECSLQERGCVPPYHFRVDLDLCGTSLSAAQEHVMARATKGRAKNCWSADWSADWPAC